MPPCSIVSLPTALWRVYAEAQRVEAHWLHVQCQRDLRALSEPVLGHARSTIRHQKTPRREGVDYRSRHHCGRVHQGLDVANHADRSEAMRRVERAHNAGHQNTSPRMPSGMMAKTMKGRMRITAQCERAARMLRKAQRLLLACPVGHFNWKPV